MSNVEPTTGRRATKEQQSFQRPLVARCLTTCTKTFTWPRVTTRSLASANSKHLVPSSLPFKAHPRITTTQRILKKLTSALTMLKWRRTRLTSFQWARFWVRVTVMLKLLPKMVNISSSKLCQAVSTGSSTVRQVARSSSWPTVARSNKRDVMLNHLPTSYCIWLIRRASPKSNPRVSSRSPWRVGLAGSVRESSHQTARVNPLCRSHPPKPSPPVLKSRSPKSSTSLNSLTQPWRCPGIQPNRICSRQRHWRNKVVVLLQTLKSLSSHLMFALATLRRMAQSPMRFCPDKWFQQVS